MKELDEYLDTLAHRLPVLSKYDPTQLKCPIRNTLTRLYDSTCKFRTES